MTKYFNATRVTKVREYHWFALDDELPEGWESMSDKDKFMWLDDNAGNTDITDTENVDVFSYGEVTLDEDDEEE